MWLTLASAAHTVVLGVTQGLICAAVRGPLTSTCVLRHIPSFFFSYPKCVSWDGFPLILDQKAACVWSSNLLQDLSFLLWAGRGEWSNYCLCPATEGGDLRACWALPSLKCRNWGRHLCFSSSLLERDEGDLCKRHVLVGGHHCQQGHSPFQRKRSSCWGPAAI